MLISSFLSFKFNTLLFQIFSISFLFCTNKIWLIEAGSAFGSTKTGHLTGLVRQNRGGSSLSRYKRYRSNRSRTKRTTTTTTTTTTLPSVTVFEYQYEPVNTEHKFYYWHKVTVLFVFVMLVSNNWKIFSGVFI